MNSHDRERRAREIQQAIGAVLLRFWDPIGIQDVVEAQDEYDSYVGPVYRLLASGASAEQVAQYLSAEESALGLRPASPSQLLPVATRLAALDVSLRGGAG